MFAKLLNDSTRELLGFMYTWKVDLFGILTYFTSFRGLSCYFYPLIRSHLNIENQREQGFHILLVFDVWSFEQQNIIMRVNYQLPDTFRRKEHVF